MLYAIRRLPQRSTLSTLPPVSATHPLTRSITPVIAVSSRSGWIRHTNSYLRTGIPPFHGFAPFGAVGPGGAERHALRRTLASGASLPHNFQSSPLGSADGA